MVSIKLDKYKLWGLITVAVSWVLYMVAMGTAWYQVNKTPVDSNSGDGLDYAIKLKIMDLVYDLTDQYGNTQHTTVAWGTWDLFWTRSVFSGAYAFAVLSFVFQTVILVILLMTIMGKSVGSAGGAAKGLAIALCIFHTLAIIIFPGITVAFNKDQTHASTAGNDPNKLFWPCQNTCTNSFVGGSSDSENKYLWAPDAGWGVMVCAWPIMFAGVILVARKINFGDSPYESKSPKKSPSSSAGVTIELPQSN